MTFKGLVRAVIALALLFSFSLASGGRDEGSVSMSLIKVAEGEKKAEPPKVKTRLHVVKKGEHIYKILRKNGLLNRPDGPELVEITRRLNKDLPNLDVIRPGDKILIPIIEADPSSSARERPTEEAAKGPKAQRAEKAAVPYEIVKVRPGESLLGIIESRYSLSAEELYNNYLPKLRELNPRLKDINLIIPGQRLRLPILDALRRQAQAAAPAAPETPTYTGDHELWKATSSTLARIFSAMGEEWIDKGRHFIPLRAGGQIELEAELFPMLSLSTGVMVLLDMKNGLSPRAARLIEESWDNYRVVGLGGADPGQALGRILPLAGFEKVLGKNESLKISEAPEIHVAGQWTLVYPAEPGGGADAIVVITDRELPLVLRDYLETLGVRWVNPSGRPALETVKGNGYVRRLQGEPVELVGEILSLTGKRYERKAVLSLERGRKGEFSINLTADYLVYLNGGKAVIDLTGLGPDMEAIIKEKGHGFLSLAGEHRPEAMVKRILGFLNTPFTEGRQEFHLARGGHVRLAAKGIAFADNRGRKIFLAGEDMPSPVAAALEATGVAPAVMELGRGRIEKAE